MGARFWEEIGNEPTSAVIVDRAVRLRVRDNDKLNETLSEADQAFEAAMVRVIMSRVDQAVEASSPDEPVFATCAKVYEEWESTMSGDVRMTLAYEVDELWFMLRSRLPDYTAEVPRDKPDYEYRGIRPFFFLVRKRIDDRGGRKSLDLWVRLPSPACPADRRLAMRRGSATALPNIPTSTARRTRSSSQSIRF